MNAFTLKEDGMLDFTDAIANRLVFFPNRRSLKNLHGIQAKNRIELSKRLEGCISRWRWRRTGKTYVYLRTIYRLHQQYGFRSSSSSLPSICHSRGVLKNLQITHTAHFQSLR